MAFGKFAPGNAVQLAKSALARFLPRWAGDAAMPQFAPSSISDETASPTKQDIAGGGSTTAVAGDSATELAARSARADEPETASEPADELEPTNEFEPTNEPEPADEPDTASGGAAVEGSARTDAAISVSTRNTTLIPRRMADPDFRAEQFANRYEGPVAPINRLVDELVQESGEWMPYVAPVYGGTDARLLTLFRDPGPKTKADVGSGMLSLQNDDPSAERFLAFFDDAGIRVEDLVTWNAYPWYINRKPTTAEIDRGLDPLARLIALLPRLAVVMVHGVDAQTAWRRFARKHPAIVDDLLVIPTYHTSKQALFTPDLDVRAQREAKLRSDFARAAEFLAG
ncbi:hypothetical protein CJ469_03385 [Nocardia farcinica]|nr:hypothetical protein CJ469_03385 [Nocardia farcinica]PFX07363.1 hypothetical protein CJ468_03544 [Nocardia farcinica]SUE26650.1 Uracil DNA glycosylase superfamily [Nocardia farcinica]